MAHPDVVSPLAFVAPPDAPGLGIVLELLANARPLGGPPTFTTITRDNPTIDPTKYAVEQTPEIDPSPAARAATILQRLVSFGLIFDNPDQPTLCRSFQITDSVRVVPPWHYFMH